jgi:hypothetical protein
MSGWIGVDLDGTLAHNTPGAGLDEIGAPIPQMMERVKRWLKEGRDVRIFTARVGTPSQARSQRAAVEAWCEKHVGRRLPVTATKDFAMVELWDDRAVQVKTNTGEPVELFRRGK